MGFPNRLSRATTISTTAAHKYNASLKCALLLCPAEKVNARQKRKLLGTENEMLGQRRKMLGRGEKPIGREVKCSALRRKMFGREGKCSTEEKYCSAEKENARPRRKNARQRRKMLSREEKYARQSRKVTLQRRKTTLQRRKCSAKKKNYSTGPECAYQRITLYLWSSVVHDSFLVFYVTSIYSTRVTSCFNLSSVFPRSGRFFGLHPVSMVSTLSELTERID